MDVTPHTVHLTLTASGNYNKCDVWPIYWHPDVSLTNANCLSSGYDFGTFWNSHKQYDTNKNWSCTIRFFIARRGIRWSENRINNVIQLQPGYVNLIRHSSTWYSMIWTSHQQYDTTTLLSCKLWFFISWRGSEGLGACLIACWYWRIPVISQTSEIWITTLNTYLQLNVAERIISWQCSIFCLVRMCADDINVNVTVPLTS